MDRRITYSSDFALRLRFRKEGGEACALPEQDFRIFARTGGRQTYTAGRSAGKLINIFDKEGEQPMMLFDAHGLATGEIHLTFCADIADSRYPDGIRHEERHCRTGVLLVPCEGDSVPDAPSALIILPDDIDAEAPVKPTDPTNPDDPDNPKPPEGYEAATDKEVDDMLNDLLNQ